MDDAMSLVDQTTLVEPDERLAHRNGQLRRERVGRAAPVRGCTNRAQLLENDAALFLDERLRAPHELLAPEVETRLAFLADQPFHDVLRRDAGVVSAGHPERF